MSGPREGKKRSDYDAAAEAAARSRYLAREAAIREIVAVRKEYCELTGELEAAALLSQIVFWHLPAASGGEKLRVRDRSGNLWLAKKREDWWAEIFLTPRQVDRALALLRARGWVETARMRFDGSPTLHYRLRWTRLAAAVAARQKSFEFPDSDFTNPLNPIPVSGNSKTEITDRDYYPSPSSPPKEGRKKPKGRERPRKTKPDHPPVGGEPPAKPIVGGDDPSYTSAERDEIVLLLRAWYPRTPWDSIPTLRLDRLAYLCSRRGLREISRSTVRRYTLGLVRNPIGFRPWQDRRAASLESDPGFLRAAAQLEARRRVEEPA